MRHLYNRKHALLIISLVGLMPAFAGQAAGQSAYVGASVVADVARFSGPPRGAGNDSSEAIGGSLRAGTAIGDRWGVDVELVRTGEVESDLDSFLLGTRVAPTVIGDVIGAPGSVIFPTPFYDISSKQQVSTLSTTLWARQRLGERADIIYLGGLAFTRTTREDHIEIQLPRINPLGGVIGAPLIQRLDNEYVFYGAGPLVGVDLHVSMTDHLRLVPGVRLQMIDDEGRHGWIIRPAVGLQWMF